MIHTVLTNSCLDLQSNTLSSTPQPLKLPKPLHPLPYVFNCDKYIFLSRSMMPRSPPLPRKNSPEQYRQNKSDMEGSEDSQDSANESYNPSDSSFTPSEKDTSFRQHVGRSSKEDSRFSRKPLHGSARTSSPGSPAGSSVTSSPGRRRRAPPASASDSPQNSPPRPKKNVNQPKDKGMPSPDQTHPSPTSSSQSTPPVSRRNARSPAQANVSPTPSPQGDGLYPSLANLEGFEKTDVPPRPQQSPPRRPQKPIPPRAQEPDENNFNLVKGVIFAIILIFIKWWFFTPSEPEPASYTMSPLERFTQDLKEFKENFPQQDKHTWITFSSAIKRIIVDDYPAQPAVILLGTTKGGRKLADCMARKLAKLVNQAYNASPPVVIDVSTEYRSLSPGDAKLALEEKFEENFQSGSRSVNLLGLEDLDGRTAMILHSYCDNENAPHKKAAIIFTFEVEETEIPSRDGNPNVAERFVEDSLGNEWKKSLNIDDTHALLSRVANNVVIINEESRDTLSNHCQM